MFEFDKKKVMFLKIECTYVGRFDKQNTYVFIHTLY